MQRNKKSNIKIRYFKYKTIARLRQGSYSHVSIVANSTRHFIPSPSSFLTRGLGPAMAELGWCSSYTAPPVSHWHLKQFVGDVHCKAGHSSEFRNSNSTSLWTSLEPPNQASNLRRERLNLLQQVPARAEQKLSANVISWNVVIQYNQLSPPFPG